MPSMLVAMYEIMMLCIIMRLFRSFGFGSLIRGFGVSDSDGSFSLSLIWHHAWFRADSWSAVRGGCLHFSFSLQRLSCVLSCFSAVSGSRRVSLCSGDPKF